jgi:hypothetical protein
MVTKDPEGGRVCSEDIDTANDFNEPALHIRNIWYSSNSANFAAQALERLRYQIDEHRQQ